MSRPFITPAAEHPPDFSAVRGRDSLVRREGPRLGRSGRGLDDLEADERGREARKGVIVRAIRLHARGGPEQMVYEDAPLPAPATGEALLRVYAAGITPTELTWS